MAIYWRLREVLDEKGITPLQLAGKLGVAHPSIYRLAAQPRITRITTAKLDALCKALDCEPGDLLTRRKR
jgi:DNA-binding Xre family transcriptional regulator